MSKYTYKMVCVVCGCTFEAPSARIYCPDCKAKNKRPICGSCSSRTSNKTRQVVLDVLSDKYTTKELWLKNGVTRSRISQIASIVALTREALRGEANAQP